MNRPVSKEDLLLEEWKVATDNARHFNDLLMILRTLGLPMVISMIAAGAALSGANLELKLMRGIIDWLGLFSAIVVLVFVIWSAFRNKRSAVNGLPIPLYTRELVMWVLASLTLLGFFIAAVAYDGYGAGFRDHRAYKVGTFVILAGLALLAALYILDRFYYYLLLIGAIKRADEIEREDGLHFALTRRISESITQTQATHLVTIFYWLPGITVMVACLMLLLFV